MAELVSQPTSTQSIYNWFRDNKLYVNRRYQRKLVWTLLEKQKLIESILKKYPIPAILVVERESERGTYEIIDGLQRLHAIVSFIETSFPTLDGNYFNIEYFPTAKNISDSGIFERTESHNLINQKDVSKILDYTLALSVMRNATEEQVNDVFDRINTYGHRLSDQERRQAGVQNNFSTLVRQISCWIRGDISEDILTLSSMPSISIDLPMSNHGYEVRSDEVFWVQQGILRSTDLRDSMDEQCIADILACIVGGEPVPRTKDALDAIYSEGNSECERILNALDIYGDKRIEAEFKYCIDQIKNICDLNNEKKLREVIFTKSSPNPFPSVFSIIFIAIHELFIKEKKIIFSYEEILNVIENLTSRIESGRKAGSPKERRRNIDTVKGLIRESFVKAQNQEHIYGSHSAIEIENAIRRSELELAHYELKQGLLTLCNKRIIDKNIINKVVKTICAMANNGPNKVGKLLIGVTDNENDAKQVIKLDKIKPKKIGQKYVVGVKREAQILDLSLEEYFNHWKNGIKNSDLSIHLRDSVLSNVDFNDFYGLGVIIFTIQPQTQISYVGDDTYIRTADSTEKAETAKQIASIAQRF